MLSVVGADSYLENYGGVTIRHAGMPYRRSGQKLRTHE